MSSEEELPQKNKQKNLPWLPDYIVENCLAHIPRSYYPKLSLVSKSFRSLVVSKELLQERYRLKTRESFFHVCLQLPKSPLPTWFTLWIRPDQIDKKKKNKFSRNTRLVQIPSSYYYPFDPVFTVMVGSEQYAFNQRNAPSPIMWVWNKESTFWHQAPNMTVARVNAVAGVFNGKIYVMGGCPAEESTNWGEVFDTKTQTWESLPDPGAELRSSSIRAIEVINGKLNVRVSNENNDDYAYDPKEGKWDVVEKKLVRCQIGNLLLSCGEQRLWWLDTKRQEWRVVRGLSMLKTTRRRGLIEIGNYGGKLLILWDKFVHPGQFQEKNIWCAVVALERRNGNGDDFEIWGNVECTNVVLTVPSSYVFLRSLQNGG